MRGCRRRSQRIEFDVQVNWPVILWCEDAAARYGALRNLSRGGLCVRLDPGTPLPALGAELTAELPLGHLASVTSFPCKVAHCWHKRGTLLVGLTFVLPEGDDGMPARQALARFLGELYGENRPGEELAFAVGHSAFTLPAQKQPS